MTNQPIIDFKPSKKQSEAYEYLMDNETDFVGYGGSAFSGKSYLECYWLTIMSLAYPDTTWFLGRQTLTILKDTTMKTLFKVFTECGLKDTIHYKLNNQSNIIRFYNGSEIFLLDLAYAPSDPLYTWLGGYEFTGGAVDESAECHRSAIETLTTRIGRKNNKKYGIRAKILETFNPAKNHVYTRYYQPWKNNTLPKEVKFVKALPQDNPSPEVGPYVERILKSSDKNMVERLIHGNFDYDDDPSRLMDFEKIIDIFGNTHVPPGRRCITCDVARLGGDKIVVIEWDGWRGKVKAYQKQTLDITGTIVEGLRYNMKIGNSDVLVDEDGMGGGLVDFLKFKGFVNNATPLASPDGPLDQNTGKRIPENYTNLKSQCYFRLAQRVQNNGIYLEVEDEHTRELIIQEFSHVKQKNMDKDGKRAVLGKDEVKLLIGRSPDFADAIMMREWFDLKPQYKILAG